MTLRFGTDGVRGAAHTELTTDYVCRLGVAAATVLGGDRWLVGRDTRESGPAFEAALAAGLGSTGAVVESLGVVPTPALAHIASAQRCAAAMITASHNPFGDNGVKIFASGGVKLPDEIEASIEAVLEAAFEATASDRADAPLPVRRTDALELYADHLTGLFAPGALAGLRLVIDGANGAMAAVAPLVARRLGAEVSTIHVEPDGRNINADCGATAPGSLVVEVVAAGADMGLAFDGDGDRVIAVDQLGRIVDGDHAIALAALQLRERGELIDDTVVVTVMSNLGFRKAMVEAGIRIVETAVGDRYVLEALDAGGYALGGEQSGHIIYRRSATTGDGLLAGLRLAEHVVERRRPLADLASEAMTSYPQVLVNVRVRERHPRVAEELATEIAMAERELGHDGRVLVRASGTEPLIRVMVEAPTGALADAVAGHLADAVRARFA